MIKNYVCKLLLQYLENNYKIYNKSLKINMGKIEMIILLIAVVVSASNLQRQYAPALQVDVHKCIQDNCPTELAACDANCQKILTDGQAKCGTYSDPRNISCWTFYLSGQRNRQAYLVFECGQKNRCFTDAITIKDQILPALQVDVHKCIQDNCPTELAACDANCQKILTDGQAKCGTYSDPRNISCWTFYLSGQRNRQAYLVFECGQKNRCFTDAITIKDQTLPALQVDVHKCIQDNCPTELAACDANCQKILTDGQAKCGTYSDPRNISCWTFYLSGQRNRQAYLVFECGQKNRCFTDAITIKSFDMNLQTLAPSVCPSQFSKCVNDPKCLSILSICNRKCIQNVGCLHNCFQKNRSQLVRSLFSCMMTTRSLQA